MPTSATTTSMMAELTLSWINEQLRAELDRRNAATAADAELSSLPWRQQAMTALSFGITSLTWIVCASLA